MPTAPHARPADRSEARTSGARIDAIALLKADHKAVKELFQAYQKAGEGKARKADIAARICEELTIHAKIEEEIFYPAGREAAGDDEDDRDMLNEAEVEHSGIKRLVGEIKAALDGGEPDDMTDAKVKVLCEYVTHHVKEEETELFPDLRKTDMDMKEVGARLDARKKELKAQKA